MRLIDQISSLMEQQERIRNIALVAHIDHGKTTLSDSLLAIAGILAPSIAGEARALDFLPEEQRRGITMKTANISLIIKKNDSDFLINLIDSPGHVDFSGKVARALRIVDGAIVVVDAVEQIMAQTETVIRQCITEGVKPILFINKIDRLINELKLPPKEIVERIEIIYTNFNLLIKQYSKKTSLPAWRVSTKNGSVVFGSALHRWALSVPLAKEKNITFNTIYKLYQENDIAALQQMLPIEEPLVDMIIDHLPDPISAQKYRLRKIWKGAIDSPIGKALVACSKDESAPMVFGTTKLLVDPHVGLLVLGRVFSGILKEKMTVRLLNTNEVKKVQNLYVFMGEEKKRVVAVPAGNTVALSGLGKVSPGETLVDNKTTKMTPFEEIKYLANPVVTVAIEPEMLRDLPQLKHLLERFDLEDPNLSVRIDDQSGEILLMGLGELHLETVVKELSKEIRCTASKPLVVLVEKIEQPSGIVTYEMFGTTISLSVEPATIPYTSSATSPEKNDKIVKLPQYQNEIIIPAVLFQQLSKDAVENILLGAENALASGPIASKPVSEVRVILKEFTVEGSEKFEHTVPAMRNAVWEALRKGKITIQEPIYRIQITIPASYLGKVTAILNKRQGAVLDVRTDQDLLIITGNLPVAESFGIDQALRSETEGRAFWQMSFDRYESLKGG
ncbi:MAG: GTP-binding protein [Candidatus Heimdallarchaeota archaeon]